MHSFLLTIGITKKHYLANITYSPVLILGYSPGPSMGKRVDKGMKPEVANCTSILATYLPYPLEVNNPGDSHEALY
jgi:hypothetical protein